jgi:TolA-binding protein
MFKNMSFGKMVAVFAGFFVLMIVGAFVYIKANQQPKNISSRQVATKVQKHRDEPLAAAAAASQPAVVLGAEQGASQAALPAQPVLQQQLGLLTGTVNEINQRVISVQAVQTSLDQRVRDAEQLFSQLDARVSDMEAKAEAKAKALRAAQSAAKKKPAEDKEKSLPEMPEHKAMAVVNNRAWIVVPDGKEESVTKGEVIPRARVRSMNPETGVVITSSDQRIDPR